MAGDRIASTRRKASWGERAFVLGGLAAAAFVTALSVAFDGPEGLLGPVWVAAAAWTVAAQAAYVLWLGFRHNDWSCLRGGGPERDELAEDMLDWSTRTGRYAYLRVREEQERLMRDD